MSVTQEIKDRLDIIDIVSEQVSLRKSGKNYAGLCPFHSNTRTPSFYVFPDTQTWHCFGACAEGGDLFNYVMKKQGWDFKETLTYLARRAGVQLEELSPQQQKRRVAEDKIVDLLTAAAEYFHQLLLHAPEAKFARDYVEKRELTPATLATFQVGFALNAWDACRTHFNNQGYSDDDLLKAGLLSENEERGTRYDRFRNRLIIPIRDSNGRVVGFGARTLEKDGIPKYLNSPQTALFDKSHLLFGLDGAKRHVREAQQAVIVEGYMDVMQGWQAGFRNIVAQMGTALTEAQLQQLKRYTKRFVIALDADAAGMAATMRSLRVARETLDREYEVHFDAHGLVRHEGRLKADIRVMMLPEGKDPDNIIQEDPTQWPKLLEQAKPVVAYVIEMLTRDLDMRDAKAKTAVAETVLPLINDVANPIERDHYRQELARALQIDARSLRMMAASTPPPQKRPAVKTAQPSAYNHMPSFSGPPPPEPPPDPYSSAMPENSIPSAVKSKTTLDSHMREANFLRQCLEYPHMLAQVNRVLNQQAEIKVSPSDFALPEDRALLELAYERAQQKTVVTSADLCDSLDTVLAVRVRTLMALPLTAVEYLDRLPERLTMSVLDLRLAKAGEQLERAQQLYRQARVEPEVDTDLLLVYARQVANTHKRIQKINKAKDAMSSTGRRRSEYGNGRS